MNAQIYYSPQRSPPLEKHPMRVKTKGGGFGHPRPRSKNTPPVFDYFKDYQAVTTQSGKSELYTFIAYGYFLVIGWFQLGYASVISRLRSGYPNLMAGILGGYWGLLWGFVGVSLGFSWGFQYM